MINRDLTKQLIKDAQKNPVIAILGPRQSGKTTLARFAFPKHMYVSLEDLDVREFANSDPRGFLKENDKSAGIIIDEIQNVPSLLSYIQTIVDLTYRPGYFVLTASQNFLVMEAVSQTLAGRVSIHTLLPLSIRELSGASLLPKNAHEVLYRGFYPSIYGKDYNPTKWYADYTKTYVERDVRTIKNVTDLSAFKKFMHLCAGRIGQVVNLSDLGNDTGGSYNTIKAWLSVLEASYIIFLLQPYYKNFNRRVIKAPKLYFFDPGIACYLLGIEQDKQVATHYARGHLFENMVIADLYKGFYNNDLEPRLYFWRDQAGNEIDCIIERASTLYPVEIKSGETISGDYFKGLTFWNSVSSSSPEKNFVIYGGSARQQRSTGTVVSWTETPSVLESILRS